jgi:hypothetical protein
MAGAAGEFDRDAGGDGGRSGGSGAARGPKIYKLPARKNLIMLNDLVN